MTKCCKHGVPTFGYCKLCCREMVDVKSMDKTSDLIRAAHAMVLAHEQNDTLLPALYSVSEQFPGIPEPLLTALWVGINAKELDIKTFSRSH